MEKKISAKKKSVGRPAKLPPGERRTVRCVLVNGEMTALRQATTVLKMSQLELTRAAVLHVVKAVNHGQPPPFLPGADGLPYFGEAGAGLPQFETMDPKEWTRIRDIYPDDAFTLRVRGDSMTNAAILDGDWAVVRPASTAEKGQLVIATVDDGLTIKKLDIVTRGENKGVWLQSVCPDERPPIQISGISDRRIIAVCIGVIGKR